MPTTTNRNEKFTLIVDSTQLSSFSECPAQWDYAHNQHLEQIGSNKKAMNMGSYGHVMLENYYKKLAIGCTTNDAVDYAVSVPPEERLELNSEEISILKDKIRIYSYTYAKGDFVPLNPESVELGFSYKLYEDDSRLFILEGKLDHYQHTPALGSYNGVRSIMDHKFQMRRHDLYEKRLQFRNYALATNSNLFVINYISMTKKTDETTFRRKVVPFSSLELELWKSRLIQMFKKMETSIKLAEGHFGPAIPYEHNWGSCENKYGYACQFAALCEANNQYEFDQAKATKFVTIGKWNPW